MNKQLHSNVFIKPVKKQTAIEVSWQYTVFIHKEPVEGLYSCFIPDFDIYFSAPSHEIGREKGDTLLKGFFDHLLLHSKKPGIKALGVELHKRGFKAQNNMVVMRDMIRNRSVKAKFSGGASMPDQFVGDHVVNVSQTGGYAIPA